MMAAFQGLEERHGEREEPTQPLQRHQGETNLMTIVVDPSPRNLLCIH